MKDEEIYNIFNTEKILKRPVTVAVDSHSGAAGIAHWMNGFYSLEGDDKIDKRDPIIAAIKEKVDALYADGRTTAMGDMELEEIFKRADFDLYKKLSAIHVRIRQ